jgi:hypothetical protein
MRARMSIFFSTLIAISLFFAPPFARAATADASEPVSDTPPVFSGAWNLLPQDSIDQFVFSPLSQEFAALAEQFPNLAHVVSDVGIARQSDLQKISGITIPLSSDEISSEAVFARTGNNKINLDTTLVLLPSGTLDRSITTTAGSILNLSVKPEHPASHVSGYLAFVSRSATAEIKSDGSLGYRAGLFLGRVFLKPSVSRPGPDVRLKWMISFASAVDTFIGRPGANAGTANIAGLGNDVAANGTVGTSGAVGAPEERLAVSQFEYTDPDGDGIYTATIQAPVVDGEYVLYTVMNYADTQYNTKEIKLTTVVDPEGYVYELNGGRETRIPGAVASIYMLDPETKQYALWPADQYGQENPQVTDVRGSYAFLTPPGTYYLTIEASGFKKYEGKAFLVAAGTNGVHTDIQLSSKYGFIHSVDWRIVLLVLVILFLLYRFYAGERRRHDLAVVARGGIGTR